MENISSTLHRPIRSFVLRQSRLSVAQKKALNNEANAYIFPFATKNPSTYLQTKPLSIPTNSEIIDRNQLTFWQLAHHYQHHILDIGFGNGDSLINVCPANTQTLFWGIEVHLPGVARLIHQATQQAIANLQIIRADAKQVIEILLPPHYFDQIRIFFPDPWHKKRHHKRRLLNHDFICQTLHTLKENGVLHIATDWQDYADFISKQITTIPQLKQAHRPLKQSLIENRPKTAYEKKGIALSHHIHELIYQKTKVTEK